MMATDSESYTVDFGKVGRTVEYRDRLGSIVFTVDIGIAPRALVLEHHGVRSSRPLNYTEAFTRTKRYLISCGYEVEEFGLAVVPVAPESEEVARIVRSQIGESKSPSIRLIDRPFLKRYQDDTDGSEWSLWLVVEVIDGPASGHKIVFDDRTKQFGVSGPTDSFHGFWGSFGQTCEAVVGE